jgi:RimJ/RimL family protein N-acetyltransferase
LVPLRERDVESIRKWRNEQIDILRQNKPLTKDEQSKYYHQVIKKSFYEKKPKIILFSFLIKNNCIGYGGFVHIDWNSKKAELSIIFDTNRTKKQETYKKEFSIFLKIILNIGFKQILFNKIFTETFDIRPDTILILEKTGFVLENKLLSKNYINGSYADSLFHRMLISDYVEK